MHGGNRKKPDFQRQRLQIIKDRIEAIGLNVLKHIDAADQLGWQRSSRQGRNRRVIRLQLHGVADSQVLKQLALARSIIQNIGYFERVAQF